MTIVSEINAIVTENGGIASTDGTIIGALDALADTLAGENVERQNSITKAIEALAPYIGGSEFEVKAFAMDNNGQNLTELSKSFFYPCKTEEDGGAISWVPDSESSQITRAQAGAIIAVSYGTIEVDDEVANLGNVLTVYIATSAIPVTSINDVVMLSELIDEGSNSFLMPMPNMNLYLLIIVGEAN